VREEFDGTVGTAESDDKGGRCDQTNQSFMFHSSVFWALKAVEDVARTGATEKPDSTQELEP
jgi:hypothetical protein